MSVFTHKISVVEKTTGKKIPDWKNYRITVDMLEPADDFSLSVKFSREAWDLLPLDTEVAVYIDETRILSGFIGSRNKRSDKSGGTMIEIAGRDKVGRLVDESVSVFSFGGLKLRGLVEKIVGITDGDGLFDSVVLDNSRNRSLLRNVKSRQAKAPREPIDPLTEKFFDFVVKPYGYDYQTAKQVKRPPLIDPGILKGRAVKRRSDPGSTRWQVLELFLREARLLAWATADGKSLFVGLPNYDQDPQYRFFEAAEGSDLVDDTNAKIDVMETVDERYSKITVIGSKTGGDEFGRGRVRLRRTVFDNPENTEDGTGIDFRRRKELIVSDDSVRNAHTCLERAERIQAERDASGREVVIDVPGHSQIYAGQVPTPYAIDTIAKVHDEATGTKGDFLLTRIEFSNDRQNGTRTQIRAVPRGTLLTL